MEFLGSYIGKWQKVLHRCYHIRYLNLRKFVQIKFVAIVISTVYARVSVACYNRCFSFNRFEPGVETQE